MKNKLGDLNNVLFEQLERLQDDDLTDEQFEKELKRSKVISSVSSNIVQIADLSIQALKIKQEYQLSDRQVPELLSND